MMKKSKNIIFYSLYAIIFCVILGFQSTSSEAATSSTKFFEAGSAPQYIAVVYTWGSMIVGGLSLIVIAYAGLTYMRSMGNQEVISQSKTLISGALIGLSLVLGGYFLLKLMDPRLVELKISIPQLDRAQDIATENCTDYLGKSCKTDKEIKQCKDEIYYECVHAITTSGNRLGRDIKYVDTYSKVQCIKGTWLFGHEKLLKRKYNNKGACGCDKITPLSRTLFDSKWCASKSTSQWDTVTVIQWYGPNLCQMTDTLCESYSE